MVTAAATDCTARLFAHELGIVGEAFEALKAPDIQIEDGVPKVIKKNWQKWCLRGNHPDKGGDNDAFIAMETRYSAFKDWFQAQRDAPARRANDRVQQKLKAKQDGDKASEGGRKALEGKQYEDAKVFAEEAIKAYEAYKNLQLRKDDAQKMVLEATKLKEEAEEEIRLRELKAYEVYKDLQLREEDAQKTVLEATKLKGEAEEQIRLRELEKGQRDTDKARIMVLEGEIERLNNENHNLQPAKSQMLLSFQEWQQKLNDSDIMRHDIIKNLERKMEEALVEANAVWQRKVGCSSWVDVGCYESIHKNLKRKMENDFDEAKKASATQVNDGVKSAIKDKTQELVRVKAELTASQKRNDELMEVMEQQQKIGDARKTSQKETQTHWKLI